MSGIVNWLYSWVYDVPSRPEIEELEPKKETSNSLTEEIKQFDIKKLRPVKVNKDKVVNTQFDFVLKLKNKFANLPTSP